MNRGFRVVFRRNVGNLYIDIFGEFNGMCAWELVKVIKRQAIYSGRVFVNTAGIGKIVPAGADLFKYHMTSTRMPADWLYLKGEKGFAIAPNGSRVLICKKNTHANPKRFHLKAVARKNHR